MRLLTTNLLNLTRRDDGIKPEIETLDSSFFDKVFTNYATIAEENGKGVYCSKSGWALNQN